LEPPTTRLVSLKFPVIAKVQNPEIRDEVWGQSELVCLKLINYGIIDDRIAAITTIDDLQQTY